MGRRRAREFALQVLYQTDIADHAGAESDGSAALLWASQLEEGGVSGSAADADEVEFAESLVQGVTERLVEIDTLIESASVNWRLVRMPAVDRNILRLATYELVASAGTPASVCINEAVELAKRFGEKESGSFVNGILDRIARVTGRGGRGKDKRRNNP